MTAALPDLDEPVRLVDAPALLGAPPLKTLKAEIRAGRLTHERIGGAILLTRRYVEHWRAIIPQPAIEGSLVYFVQSGEFVKIGVTRNAERRIRTLQTNNPVTLTLLGTCPGDLDTETWLHRRFGHLHHRDEWFRLTDEIRDFIEGLQ